MRADAAKSVEARHAHSGLARGYAARIRSLQVELGAAPMPVAA